MRPGPGTDDRCVVCGTDALLNIVGRDGATRREFATICDTDMQRDWWNLWPKASA